MFKELIHVTDKLVNDHSVNVVDVGAVGISVATFLQILSGVSATLTVLWMGLRIYVLIRDEFFKKDKPIGNE